MHAFPDKRKGELNLTIRNIEKDEILFAIEDSGVGINEEFDFEHSGTLGLSLVRTLVDQLGGTLEVRRASPTRFEIVIPENID